MGRARPRDIAGVLEPFGYGPTGQVFNSTSAPAGAPVRPAVHQLSHAARRTLWKVAKRTGIR